VQETIEKVQDRVHAAIDKALEWLVSKAKALWGKLTGKGPREDAETTNDSEKSVQLSITFQDGENKPHRMWINSENRARLWVASDHPGPVEDSVKSGGEFEKIDGSDETKVIALAKRAEELTEKARSLSGDEKRKTEEEIRRLMEEIKAILTNYSGPPTLEHMCPAVGGSALRKWEQLKSENQPGAVAVRDQFIANCDKKLAEAFAKDSSGKASANKVVLPLQVMKDEVRSHQETYLLKGNEVPLQEIEKEGGCSRVLDFPSVWSYYLPPRIQQRWVNGEDFANAVNQGEYDPRPDVRGQIRGSVAEAWWFAASSDNGLTAAQLKKQLTIDSPAYDFGMLKVNFSPADAFGTLKLRKPTVFDGMIQGGERDPLWESAPDKVWGVTRGGLQEGVASPIDIRKATSMELKKGKASGNNALLVEFEGKLAAKLLRAHEHYRPTVLQVSRGVLKYVDTKADLIANGVKSRAKAAARAELAKFTMMAGGNEKELFFGRIADTIEKVDGKTFAEKLRRVLSGGGTIPNHLLAHQDFMDHIYTGKDGDYASGIASKVIELMNKAVREAQPDSTEDAYFLEAPKSLRDERFEGPNRGRTKPTSSDRIESRVDQASGLHQPAKSLHLGKKYGGGQRHRRGIDYWTLDEENAFIQYARQVLDVPLSAGISGTTTDLLECARIMGVRSENETFKYTMAVLGHLGAAGAHSFHEIMSAAAKAGIRYRQGDYTSLLQYDVPETVRELFREKKYSKIAGIGTSLKG